MDFKNFWKEMPTIWGTQNRLIKMDALNISQLPKGAMDFIDETREIADRITNLLELERELAAYYWTRGRKTYSPEGIRCANVFAFPDTAISRKEEDIIIPNWETDVMRIENNWNNVKDSLGWSSLNPGPTPWYWSMWKVPELRPMNAATFDSNFHREVMNASVQFDARWIAFEKNKDWEIAIMPLIAILQAENNSAIEKLLSMYPDIPDLTWTAKYYGINS